MCSWSILCLPCVFGMSSTKLVYTNNFGKNWLQYRDMAVDKVYPHSSVPQFLSESSDLLLEDETHSTRYHGYATQHITTSIEMRKKTTCLLVIANWLCCLCLQRFSNTRAFIPCKSARRNYMSCPQRSLGREGKVPREGRKPLQCNVPKIPRAQRKSKEEHG